MPKLLWVALPLLLAAAVLAVSMVRGRTPSRHAINIGVSVLLLVYVATTAGLGIFWVANQQLPVFDWHYLFGYGTVLLLSLHLVFNFPLVWRFFVRRRRKVPDASAIAPPAAPRTLRRGVIGALGAVAAAGAAYTLGLRQGRNELKFDAAPDPVASAGGAAPDPATDPAAQALAWVERFHAHTSHSRAGVFSSAPAASWGDPPPPFKRVVGTSDLRLPAPGAARATPFDLGALADILWHTTGVTERRGGLHLRASPSSGALFSTELYVAAAALRGLAPGLWHHDPRAHALAPWGRPAAREQLVQALADGALRDAPVLVVATAIFRRTGHKYRDRTYRYVLADLGHALENLRVAAETLGVSVQFAAAFDESRAAQALGLDEGEEGVLALIALGTPPVAALQGASITAAGRASTSEASPWRAAAPSRPNAALGVTAAMHAASSLRAAAGPLQPASAAVASGAAGQAPPRPHVALPAAASRAPGTPDGLRLIATRRSVRRYGRSPLSLQLLADVLHRITTLPGTMLSTAVRVNLVVHEVAGLAAGAYRYDHLRHALVPAGVAPASRAASRAAALDQDVIGDAAVVFVLSIDRASFAADALGPARGYRHALLEAGLVGERVYLEAAAQGLGACGVGAFYDDEASALVGVDSAREWVVHFAALGPRGDTPAA